MARHKGTATFGDGTVLFFIFDAKQGEAIPRLYTSWDELEAAWETARDYPPADRVAADGQGVNAAAYPGQQAQRGPHALGCATRVLGGQQHDEHDEDGRVQRGEGQPERPPGPDPARLIPIPAGCTEPLRCLLR